MKPLIKKVIPNPSARIPPAPENRNVIKNLEKGNVLGYDIGSESDDEAWKRKGLTLILFDILFDMLFE